MLSFMRALLVARVSSDGQAHNVSKDVQLDSMRAFVQSQPGGQVVGEFFDVASGTEKAYEERTELHKALDRLRNKEADTLVVYDITRAARDDMTFERLLSDIFKSGGRLGVSNDYRVFGNKAEASEALYWAKSASTYEGLVRDRRTQSAKLRQAEQGSFIGAVPFGYRLEKRGKIKFPVVVEGEAEIVRGVYERLKKGETKINVIKWAHSLGMAWDNSSIARLLKRADIYSGKPVEYSIKLLGQPRTFTYTFPPIIDSELAQRANKAPSYRKPSTATPYLGILFCYNCLQGAGITSSKVNKAGKKACSLCCRSKQRIRKRRERGQHEEFQCKRHIQALTLHKLIVPMLEDKPNALQPEPEKEARLKTRIETLEKERDNILRAYVEAASQGTAAALTNALSDKVNSIEKQIGVLNRRYKNVKEENEHRQYVQTMTTAQVWQQGVKLYKEAVEDDQWYYANSILSTMMVKIFVDFRAEKPYETVLVVVD